MINIEIRDATALSKVELMATAKYLLELAGHGMVEAKAIPDPRHPGTFIPSHVDTTGVPKIQDIMTHGTPMPLNNNHTNTSVPLPILATTEDFKPVILPPEGTRVRVENIPGYADGVYVTGMAMPMVGSSIGDMDGKETFICDEYVNPVEMPDHERSAAEVFGVGKSTPELFNEAKNNLADAFGFTANETLSAELDPNLDSEGLPWDRRIHARTKTKIADGTWKLARGSDASIVAGVKAELRKTMAIPKPLTYTPPSPPREVVYANTPIPTPPIMSFGELTMKISKAMAEQRITHLQIGFILKEIGIESLPVLAARADLVPVVSQRIDEVLANV